MNNEAQYYVKEIADQLRLEADMYLMAVLLAAWINLGEED